MIRHAFLAAWLIGAAQLAQASEHQGRVAGSDKAEQPSWIVAAIAEESWQGVLASDNALRDAAGLPFVGVKDIDRAEAERDAAAARTLLARLRVIDPAALTPDEEITRQFLIKFNKDIAEGPDNWVHDFAITPYSGVLPLNGLIELASKWPLATPKQRAEYLWLLTEIGDRLDQMKERTIAQRDAGIYLAKPAIASLRATYLALAGGVEARLVPSPARLAAMPDSGAESFTAAARGAAAARITAGLTDIAVLLDADYETRAPAAIGLSQYPGGRERYRRAIATYTTTDQSPEQLHALGLQLVANTQRRLAELRVRIGFAGSQADFHRMLDTDPRFRVADAGALEALYRKQIVRIEPHIPRYFGRQPKAGYGIRRIPAASEGGVAFGYYEKPSSVEPLGLFRYNGANLDRRSMVQAAAINYHELIPGHHFHLALQAEHTALPPIRRELASLRLSAYNEGWAQYAANLAIEMGAVKDPYDHYGLVALDAMMAARLVVDTGVNALGWDFEQARDYLVAHTMMSSEQASAEVLRYATDVPGQALAYKLGHEKFAHLRREAEAALGAGFDIREFHDTVLSPGAVQLDLLETHVRNWVAEMRSR
ncbi:MULTISPECIES: DUF885 domain-containing protein [unclassified Sphingopyxis]|uniref:DUF885 domain-containing protein n=1 Tax=unclassified Sphingopyxis TaxID=2614943 RepID=UPI001F60494C|nr:MULTISPECIES: DUF885 domain-containing protein [unclassified Sphingopyxis]USI76621.1 DUF885 domain-containing protein [Sphingopyxis sp. USTB-05]